MAAPTVQCPTCQREVSWTDEFPFRPFCSERCKMVDLGAWFAEERKVPGDPADPMTGDGGPSPRSDGY